MKKVCCSILALLFVATGSFGQSDPWGIIGLPDSLKRKADVIKRSEEINLEIDDVDQAVLNVHRILTVMSERGKDALLFYQHSSKAVLLSDADIRVYDANGRQLGHYKKKDMTTVPNGEGLIEDGYVTYYRVSTPAYPVTVEYSYTQKYKGTLWLPGYVVNLPDNSVLRSTYTVKAPRDFPLRYAGRNIKLDPAITEDDKYRYYKWSVSNMPSFEYEAGSSLESHYPYIMVAPNRFSYYGREGDLSSWKSYGQWMANLYNRLDALPDDRKAFFTDLVKNAGSDREKARIIYDYLQKNFRYVSIQLGIGGFRPFPADFTDKKKYGDCKGLSNFMKAALGAVGIKSYVAVINSFYNSEPVNADFPSDYGLNHVILCIPQPKDSIWLECTSQTSDFGILGEFTENRYALLVTEQGGVLVRTPASKYSNNTLCTTTKVAIRDEGSGQTNSILNATGEFRELLHEVMNEKDDEKKSFVVNTMGARQPDEFSMQKKEQQDGHLFVSLNMNVEKIPAFMAGNKMFLSPRMYRVWADKLPGAQDRKKDYYFRNPFERTDTTIFQLPAGYVAEALPESKTFDCPYGTYVTKYWFNETERAVYSTAQLRLTQHHIPAASYAGVKKFFDDVVIDDAQRIVVKKGG